MARVYCTNCHKDGEPKLKGSGIITFILLLFYIVPGIIYMAWRRTGLGICRFCGSDRLVLEGESARPYVHQRMQSMKPLENVRQVNCPDCRELIRFDARKCKHCGSYVDPQDN